MMLTMEEWKIPMTFKERSRIPGLPEYYVRFSAVCRRWRTAEQHWQLWNWVDCQATPEPLWAIMQITCPEHWEE